MNIVSTTNISKAANSDKSGNRTAIKHIRAIPNGSDESVYVIATDSHVLAVCKENGEVPEKGVLIPGSLISTAKADNMISSKDGIKWENLTTSKVGITEDSAYPDLSQVIHEDEEIETTITLNPELLYNLAQALSARGNSPKLVTILIPKDKGRAMHVIPTKRDSSGEFGLIMPCIDNTPTAHVDFVESVTKFKAALAKSDV